MTHPLSLSLRLPGGGASVSHAVNRPCRWVHVKKLRLTLIMWLSCHRRLHKHTRSHVCVSIKAGDAIWPYVSCQSEHELADKKHILMIPEMSRCRIDSVRSFIFHTVCSLISLSLSLLYRNRLFVLTRVCRLILTQDCLNIRN